MSKLQFGEEITLEDETSLGDKDEVAFLVCLLCGVGWAVGCAICGCEFPPAFGAGVAIFSGLSAETIAQVTAFGAVAAP